MNFIQFLFLAKSSDATSVTSSTRSHVWKSVNAKDESLCLLVYSRIPGTDEIELVKLSMCHMSHHISYVAHSSHTGTHVAWCGMPYVVASVYTLPFVGGKIVAKFIMKSRAMNGKRREKALKFDGKYIFWYFAASHRRCYRIRPIHLASTLFLNFPYHINLTELFIGNFVARWNGKRSSAYTIPLDTGSETFIFYYNSNCVCVCAISQPHRY